VLVESWTLALCCVVACVAAITDLRARTIPNWLTLPLSPAALLVHGSIHGCDGLWLSLLGCVSAFAPAYFLFARGALGGGDVKLFAGFGALLGPRAGLELELSAFVLVALYALWTAAWHARLGALLRASLRASLRLVAPARFGCPVGSGEGPVELPMGAAILLAVVGLCLRSLT
jgi:prepilin peptidase CpaA